MNKILIFLSVMSFTASAQTYEIYDYNYGVQSLTPHTVIKEDNNSIKVYETNFGIPDITPKYIIEPETETKYNIYETTNGIKNIQPTQTIYEKGTSTTDRTNREVSNFMWYRLEER